MTAPYRITDKIRDASELIIDAIDQTTAGKVVISGVAWAGNAIGSAYVRTVGRVLGQDWFKKMNSLILLNDNTEFKGVFDEATKQLQPLKLHEFLFEFLSTYPDVRVELRSRFLKYCIDPDTPIPNSFTADYFVDDRPSFFETNAFHADDNELYNVESSQPHHRSIIFGTPYDQIHEYMIRGPSVEAVEAVEETSGHTGGGAFFSSTRKEPEAGSAVPPTRYAILLGNIQSNIHTIMASPEATAVDEDEVNRYTDIRLGIVVPTEALTTLHF